jgi:hypothetical protein
MPPTTQVLRRRRRQRADRQPHRPQDLPADFITNVDAGIRLLAGLESGEFGLEGTTYHLTGRVDSDARRDEVLKQIAALPTAAGWQTDVTLLAPLDLCRQRVAAFASRNAILFQSGSTRIADDSLPAVDELAAYLTACRMWRSTSKATPIRRRRRQPRAPGGAGGRRRC